MGIVLGVDVGGSTTKIVALCKGRLIKALQVSASDQITSLYGAMGNLLSQLKLPLGQVEQVILTGVGSTLVHEDIYGIPTQKTDEFEAIGRGGLMLSGFKEALVVSMGTGTAFVRAEQGRYSHIGGSGVGGGTLLGLSSKLLDQNEIEAVLALAAQGDLNQVDLTIQEISQGEIPSLPAETTASNFGKIKSTATKSDMALGLINLIFQTAGVLASFACMGMPHKNVVVVGTMATLPQAPQVFGAVGRLYGVEFIIPEKAPFATALGAAAIFQDIADGRSQD